jgi:hypothetical protein
MQALSALSIAQRLDLTDTETAHSARSDDEPQPEPVRPEKTDALCA